MPRKTAAEKEEARRLQAEKQAERVKRREEKDKQKSTSLQHKSLSSTTQKKDGGGGGGAAAAAAAATSVSKNTKNHGTSAIVELPGDALTLIFCYLPSKELAALSMTCQSINYHLKEGRIQHLLTRLSCPKLNHPTRTYDHKEEKHFHIQICEGGEMEIRSILERSLMNGGDTRRIITKKSQKHLGADEYPTYARFIEEAVSGYATQNFGKDTYLPKFVSGRFLSTSPEHTVSRVGGGDGKGGGSGAACWGVGKRGQLGQGKREDEAKPLLLLGGIGYKVRIVQVSGGGGLVRIAHTLLLTSTGQVLSFGTAQYGQLGHGYSAGKQLPDELRPRYIEALSRYRVTCISAGELHSGAVTDDGDLYCWGDGFCGQLGLGGKRPQLLPQQVTKGGLEDECVASVSCGARHTICITEDGEAFSFGLGHYGALGRAFTPFEYDADDGALPNLEPVDTMAEAEPAAYEPPNAVAPGRAFAQAEMSSEMENHLNLLANVTLNDNSDQCIPMIIDALRGIHVIGASTGHRHSMILDDKGQLYTFGNGVAGELGHGNFEKHNYPVKVMEFVEIGAKIIQMSAGVDFSMAVSSMGNVYSWGRSRRGRLGLQLSANEGDHVTIPRSVHLPVKAVDVECGYIHAMIVGVDGTIFRCGNVGINGDDDGGEDESINGSPVQIPDFNIWHRTPEPKKQMGKTERWKKYGKYETKGRSKMMEEAKKWS